jgi:hypothetical protein
VSRAQAGPTEAQHQEALFALLARVERRDPRAGLAFHVPNGGLRSKATAARLKAQGVRPGVPDVLLPCPARGHTGLAVELKRQGGRLAPAQEAWLDALEAQGWRCVVAWRWEDAAREILEYLGHAPKEYGL